MVGFLISRQPFLYGWTVTLWEWVPNMIFGGRVHTVALKRGEGEEKLTSSGLDSDLAFS
jgi:hypothetical protein